MSQSRYLCQGRADCRGAVTTCATGGGEPIEDRRQSCSVQAQTRRASGHHDRTAVADPVTEQFSTILRKTRANPLNFLFLFSTLAVTCIARGSAGTRASTATEFSTLFVRNMFRANRVENAWMMSGRFCLRG